MADRKTENDSTDILFKQNTVSSDHMCGYIYIYFEIVHKVHKKVIRLMNWVDVWGQNVRGQGHNKTKRGKRNQLLKNGEGVLVDGSLWKTL